MSGIRRLGDLVTVLRGRDAANTVSDPAGPRFFGIAEISARGGTAPRYLAEDGALADRVLLGEEDVVVALLGNIGNATLVPHTAEGSVLGRECVALRVTSPDVLRPAWLCAWLSTQEFRAQVAQNTSGTTMPRLTPKALTDFTVVVPPLDKQLKIEELVRRFDRAIATTAASLGQLEALQTAELQLEMADQ
jgi:hypothetical protein